MIEQDNEALVKRLRTWAENESQFNPTDRSRLLQSIIADHIEAVR